MSKSGYSKSTGNGADDDEDRSRASGVSDGAALPTDRSAFWYRGGVQQPVDFRFSEEDPAMDAGNSMGETNTNRPTSSSRGRSGSDSRPVGRSNASSTAATVGGRKHQQVTLFAERHAIQEIGSSISTVEQVNQVFTLPDIQSAIREILPTPPPPPSYSWSTTKPSPRPRPSSRSPGPGPVSPRSPWPEPLLSPRSQTSEFSDWSPLSGSASPGPGLGPGFGFGSGGSGGHPRTDRLPYLARVLQRFNRKMAERERSGAVGGGGSGSMPQSTIAAKLDKALSQQYREAPHIASKTWTQRELRDIDDRARQEGLQYASLLADPSIRYDYGPGKGQHRRRGQNDGNSDMAVRDGDTAASDSEDGDDRRLIDPSHTGRSGNRGRDVDEDGAGGGEGLLVAPSQERGMLGSYRIVFPLDRPVFPLLHPSRRRVLVDWVQETGPASRRVRAAAKARAERGEDLHLVEQQNGKLAVRTDAELLGVGQANSLRMADRGVVTAASYQPGYLVRAALALEAERTARDPVTGARAHLSVEGNRSDGMGLAGRQQGSEPYYLDLVEKNSSDDDDDDDDGANSARGLRGGHRHRDGHRKNNGRSPEQGGWTGSWDARRNHFRTVTGSVALERGMAYSLATASAGDGSGGGGEGGGGGGDDSGGSSMIVPLSAADPHAEGFGRAQTEAINKELAERRVKAERLRGLSRLQGVLRADTADEESVRRILESARDVAEPRAVTEEEIDRAIEQARRTSTVTSSTSTSTSTSSLSSSSANSAASRPRTTAQQPRGAGGGAIGGRNVTGDSNTDKQGKIVTQSGLPGMVTILSASSASNATTTSSSSSSASGFANRAFIFNNSVAGGGAKGGVSRLGSQRGKPVGMGPGHSRPPQSGHSGQFGQYGQSDQQSSGRFEQFLSKIEVEKARVERLRVAERIAQRLREDFLLERTKLEG